MKTMNIAQSDLTNVCTLIGITDVSIVTQEGRMDCLFLKTTLPGTIFGEAILELKMYCKPGQGAMWVKENLGIIAQIVNA